jgi:hypothetical protein
LWIEDFGGNLEAGETTLNLLFGQLLSFKAWDEDEYRLLSRPDDLRRYCDQQSHHRIDLCLNYFDYVDLKEKTDLIKTFDLVLIDIRLDNNVDLNRTVPGHFATADSFHKNAGFYIFNDLLHQGFPRNKLCFLTGETGTLDNFQTRLNELHIPEATGFEKTDGKYPEIRTWMDEQHSDYYRLRRGIIEACQYLRKQIDKFRIQPYLSMEQQPDDHIDLDDYLGSLERLLPVYEPTDTEKAILYRIVLRTLSHEWEGLKPVDRKRADDPSIWAFSWIMKTTRNWITHNSKSIFNRLTAQDVAYFFICNMRALFNLDDVTHTHERLLLDLFTKDETIDLSGNNAIPLLEHYVKYFNEKDIPSTYFHSRLNDLQKDSEMLKRHQEDRFFMTALYQFFWFLTADFKVKPEKAQINKNKPNQVYVQSYYTLKPYDYTQSPFLLDFTRHIFTTSFSVND